MQQPVPCLVGQRCPDTALCNLSAFRVEGSGNDNGLHAVLPKPGKTQYAVG
jgi:hypothetical protein